MSNKKELVGHLVVAAHNLNDCKELNDDEQRRVAQILDDAQSLETSMEEGWLLRGGY